MAALALAMICATHLAVTGSVPFPPADQTHIETGKDHPEVAATRLEAAASGPQ